METAFVILLAGCSHDLSLCEPVQSWEVTVANQAACESLLEEKLFAATADWPVFQASCIAVESGFTIAAPAQDKNSLEIAG